MAWPEGPFTLRPMPPYPRSNPRQSTETAPAPPPSRRLRPNVLELNCFLHLHLRYWFIPLRAVRKKSTPVPLIVLGGRPEGSPLGGRPEGSHLGWRQNEFFAAGLAGLRLHNLAALRNDFLAAF